MKYEISLLSALGAALLFTGGAYAQDMSTTSSSDATHTAVYQTPKGELTVHSLPANTQSYGPAPAFAKLAGSGKSISADQANAYPPLANDFEHADSNRDNRISKSEYERWLKQDSH